jgi:hypothetical protein
MATTATDPGLTRAQLIKVVRTGTEMNGVAKMRALAALQHRPEKEARNVLLEVVANKREAPRFRHMAALGLYRVGGSKAREALTTAAEQADESSAATLAMGLGRIGTADNLAVVERLEAIAPSFARDRARFAQTLLAYRHGLEGNDVKAPVGSALQELGRRKAQPIETRRARKDEAATALEALVDEPLDIDLTTERALRIDCQPNTFVWLWTSVTAEGGFAPLASQKAVAGVLFRKRLFQNGYALSAIGLSTPMRGGTRLTLHRPETGAISYVGTVGADGSLELKARSRPGVAAVAIKARVEAGSVEVMTAQSALVSSEAKAPKRA